jgi:4-hydroxybenzoate polyprenyltransferase
MDSAPLPDAANDNWVDRFAPKSLQPWLKLGRFDRPAGAWLLLLPGWQGIALASAEIRPDHVPALPDPLLLAKFLVGAFLMRAAGCAWNDILDRDLDAKVARTARRPVASGQISVKQAMAFLAVCSLISFAILLTMPPMAIALGVASLILVAAYPLMKRITWWPQAWLGLTFNWGALLGYAAATGELTLPPVLLYASGIFWTLGYDTIYAIQDMEDDALAGVKSSARRLGWGAPRAILGFYGMTALLAFAAGYAAHLGPLFALFGVLYALHLFRQAAQVRMDNSALALRLFRSNRTAGLILLFGLAAGMWRLG